MGCSRVRSACAGEKWNNSFLKIWSTKVSPAWPFSSRSLACNNCLSCDMPRVRVMDMVCCQHFLLAGCCLPQSFSLPFGDSVKTRHERKGSKFIQAESSSIKNAWIDGYGPVSDWRVPGYLTSALPPFKMFRFRWSEDSVQSPHCSASVTPVQHLSQTHRSCELPMCARPFVYCTQL